MTTKTRRFRFGIIVLVCVVLISLFAVIQSIKTNSKATAVFDSMEGYVLTSQGIEEVQHKEDSLESTIILEKDDIVSFDVLDGNTIFYSTLLNPNDRTQFNGYAYDIGTKVTKPIFESSADFQYTDMLSVGQNKVGAIRNIAAENVQELVLFDMDTEEETVVRSPAAENYVTSWVASPDGSGLAFKGISNDTYYYSQEAQETNLIGTFDNVYGFLDNETVWLSNIADDSKMTVYNAKSTQVKAVDFSEELSKKTFIDGTLLSAGPPEKVLWIVSGFFEADAASQKVITTDGNDFDVLYDLTEGGYKFLNTASSFDETKQIMSIDAIDQNDQNVILVISTSNGKLLDTLEGRHFLFAS